MTDADRGRRVGRVDRPGRPGTPPRRRSFLEVRWRQLRNPPRPIVRAIGSSLAVGVVLGLLYLAYDVALSRGAPLPGGDLRPVAAGLVVLGIAVGGSVATYLFVPLPTGSGPATRIRRTGWSALLGLFAAIPIAYLVLVVVAQVLKPLLI